MDFSVIRGIIQMCHRLFHSSPPCSHTKKAFPNQTVISGDKTKGFYMSHQLFLRHTRVYYYYLLLNVLIFITITCLKRLLKVRLNVGTVFADIRH